MAWNAANCQHETTIPLPIGKYEFKFVVLSTHYEAKFVILLCVKL
jgi:hypothetical protein